jgi:hypothetical protein
VLDVIESIAERVQLFDGGLSVSRHARRTQKPDAAATWARSIRAAQKQERAVQYFKRH